MLDEGVSSICDWGANNNIRLNIDINKYRYKYLTVHNNVISPAINLECFGFYIDSELRFNTHIMIMSVQKLILPPENRTS